MAYIVMGQRQDHHALAILEELKSRGESAYLLETYLFPHSIQFSFSPNNGGGSLTLSCGTTLKFSDIKAVFWRSFCGVSDESTKGNFCTLDDIAARDSLACLRTWFRLSNSTLWVNSWDAYQHHKEKPLQLFKVAKLGINIPQTYIGNTLSEIRETFERLECAIFKPVFGGAHTEMLTEAHLEDGRVEAALAKAPITIQNFIEGTNIRTYVLGERVISAELRSESADFREDPDLQTINIDTPETIIIQSRKIARELGLNWTAIDWRRDTLGEYYFLEANPSPMFLGFEKRSGVPMVELIADYLTQISK